MRFDPPLPTYFEGMAYRINAIVYDNHSPDTLYRFMFDQLEYLSLMIMVEQGEAPDTIEDYFEEVDIESNVVCPFVRVARLYDHACSIRRAHSCTLVQQADEAFAVIEAQAKERGICFKERTLPASTLGYAPMSVELGG